MRHSKLRFGLRGESGCSCSSSCSSRRCWRVDHPVIGAVHQSADVLVFNDQARKNIGLIILPSRQPPWPPWRRCHQPAGGGTFTVQAGGAETDVVFGYVLGGPGAPTTLRRACPRPRARPWPAKGRGDGFRCRRHRHDRRPRRHADLTIVGVARDLNYSIAPTCSLFDTFAAAKRCATGCRAAPRCCRRCWPWKWRPAPMPRRWDRIAAAVAGVEPLTRQQADRSPASAAPHRFR